MLVAVEVVVDVEGIEGGIKRSVTRPETQPPLHQLQQREEICVVPLVKGLGQLGQHKLSPVRHLGDHDAGSIAPVELADADRQSFGRKAFRSGGSKAVVAALAAQLAVWVTGWLVCFVKAAFLYIGLG